MIDFNPLIPAFSRREKEIFEFLEVPLNLKESGVPVNLPDCYIRIAELAYYKAESRSFEPGHELDDWFEAEREFMQ